MKTDFEKSLEEATKALDLIGSGKLKSGPIVREGARAYAGEREKMPRLRTERRLRFDYQAFLIVGGLCYFITAQGLSWGLETSLALSISVALMLSIEDRKR